MQPTINKIKMVEILVHVCTLTPTANILVYGKIQQNIFNYKYVLISFTMVTFNKTWTWFCFNGFQKELPVFPGGTQTFFL